MIVSRPARLLAATALALGLVGAAAVGWYQWRKPAALAGIASGNGRLEAVELNVAVRQAGRLQQLLVVEGQDVRAGQELARLDTAPLLAQRDEASALVQRSADAVRTAQAQIGLRGSELNMARAAVEQRDSELDAARRHLARSQALLGAGGVSAQQVDDERARVQGAQSALSAARAQVEAAQAALRAAQSQQVEAQSAQRAAQAGLRRIQVDLDDCNVRAPVDGQVQYLIARPGEVLAAGARVLNMVDSADLSMSFFLPEADAGRVLLGDPARLVLDAHPGVVVPARVSFVSAVAQFTPKTVETASEREKLMFRVKARVDPAWAAAHLPELKGGMPGLAYVRLRRDVDWPPPLQVR